MKKTLSLLLFFVLASPPLVFGGLFSDWGLEGLDEIKVSISDFDKETERDGFNSRTYKNAVELRFRQLGLPVVDEYSNADGNEFLLRGHFYLNITPLKIDEYGYAVFLNAYLVRGVDVFNGQEWNLHDAKVWQSGTLFFVGMRRVESIKRDVIDFADDFANDYLKVNPPEPRSGQESE